MANKEIKAYPGSCFFNAADKRILNLIIVQDKLLAIYSSHQGAIIESHHQNKMMGYCSINDASDARTPEVIYLDGRFNY